MNINVLREGYGLYVVVDKVRGKRLTIGIFQLLGCVAGLSALIVLSKRLFRRK